jgi:hypothetical protein
LTDTVSKGVGEVGPPFSPPLLPTLRTAVVVVAVGNLGSLSSPSAPNFTIVLAQRANERGLGSPRIEAAHGVQQVALQQKPGTHASSAPPRITGLLAKHARHS